MKIVVFAPSLAGFILLAGCGGGGGGGSSSAPAPTISDGLSSASGTASVLEGATATTQTVTATVTTTGNFTTSVVPDIAYDKAVYSSVAAVAGATPGTYTVTLTTQPNLGGGTYASPVTFRLCQDTACSQVYAGTTQTYNFTLTVNLLDWVTFQRNAGHTGYVHVALDPTKFATAWTFTNPDNSDSAPVITAGGAAFFGAQPHKVYSLNEATGAVNWVKDLSTDVNAVNPGAMAYANGSLYVPTSSLSPPYGNNAVWTLDATTGKAGVSSPFQSQGAGFNSPVVQGGDLFFAQGYYGGVVYRYALPAGTQTWASAVDPGVSTNQQSPAVDNNYVYFSNHFSVAIYNRTDGSLYAKVGDPVTFTGPALGYESPVITAAGHVLISRNPSLIAVDPVSKSVVWRSKANYDQQPAAASGVIYVGRSFPYAIDALSDTDGSVLWSWSIPATDIQLIGNPVVCDNLLFVSTDKATYAIDLKTHQTAWTTAAHGQLSLSAGYILYIASEAQSGASGAVTAVKLR